MISPRLIFDKIEDIVRANDKFVSIARTPADLYADKHNGRKSIMPLQQEPN